MTCNGRKTVVNKNGKTVTCPACDGKGGVNTLTTP